MSTRQTNRQLAADLIITLVKYGLMKRSSIDAAVNLVDGLRFEDIQEAFDRREAAGWGSLPRVAKPESERPPQRQHGGVKRKRKTIDGVKHLWCTGVKDQVDPHFAPIDEFDERPDRLPPNNRKSKCSDCWRRDQKRRRISKDAERAFDEAHVDILYDDVGAPVGLECTLCGSKVGCHCDTQPVEEHHDDEARDRVHAGGGDRDSDQEPEGP